MRATLVMSAGLLARCVFPAEALNVSVCNQGTLSDSVVRQAEAETQAVFQSSGIRIQWSDCDRVVGPRAFTIRLRGDKPPKTAGASSLDSMGRAFVAENGSGYLADAYIQAIRELSKRHGANAAALLGVVIAHELGHLLLGPGHTSGGVMRSIWTSSDVTALNHRWLTFNSEQSTRMRTILTKSE